jgi:thymidylate synthase (FAD)
MKIATPSAKLIWATPEPEKMIERAGRVCYKSEHLITDYSAAKFVQMLVEREHGAMLEHAGASILFTTDRGVTHEFVRHRIPSFAQESTRYCNYSKDKFGNEISVIEPPGLRQFERNVWLDACEFVERNYLDLIGKGVSPQIARSVLPTCLKTELVVTTNFREWRHILKLRSSPAAHPQIRQLMGFAFDILTEIAPTVFPLSLVEEIKNV